jgi:hypothetical protein
VKHSIKRWVEQIEQEMNLKLFGKFNNKFYVEFNLDGLLRVHSFLRFAVSHGRADCLRLLFVGKLDLEDVPALSMLTQAGLCRPAQHLPPWAEDLRFLVGYLAWSSFLNRVDMQRVTAHYATLLADTPLLDAREAG